MSSQNNYAKIMKTAQKYLPFGTSEWIVNQAAEL